MAPSRNQPKTLTIEHGEYDQTPTVACIDCGPRFPVLDELTGASGRCAHCEARALERDNEPIGQGREPQRAPGASGAAHQGREGKDSGDGSPGFSASCGALRSFGGTGFTGAVTFRGMCDRRYS